MVAFNFTVFTDKVADRSKRMTIRRTARAKPGDRIQLYTGMRTKACRKLVEEDAVCIGVFLVRVHETYVALATPVGPWRLYGPRPVNAGVHTRGVLNDGVPGRDAFASFDGFPNWIAMRDWFADKYGLPFTGYAHVWEFPTPPGGTT